MGGRRNLPDGRWEEEVALSSGKEPSEFHIVGVDEVGRGALAGPVTAGCVVFSPPVSRFSGYGITDSKLLSPEKRETLSSWIMQRALHTGLGWASVEEVDRLNIRQATLLAMRRAIQTLPSSFFKNNRALFVLDGKELLPDFPYPQKAVIKGDSIVLSIAAASIFAKVARDSYMDELDAQAPEYLFRYHKGYGTEDHRNAIRKYGISPHHRMKFCAKTLEA